MTQKPAKTARASQANPPAPWKSRVRKNRAWITGGAVATALIGSALFNRASARRAEAAEPPVGSFIEVNGVRLHYVDRGSGPAVVLLHGNGVMLQDFQASGVLEMASEQYRVIAFDRPGFGYSDRPRTTVWTPKAQARLIAGALKALGVGPALIVGHSWGTLVSLAMALDEPGAVAGLLLLSGYYYGTARPDVWPFSVPAIPLIGDVIAYTVSPLAGRLISPAAIKAAFSPAPISERFNAFPLALTLRPSQVRATAADTAMMVPAALEFSRRYADLSLPVMIMAGAGDLIAHAEKHAERLVSEVEGAELRIVPEQGHLFHYAVPWEVVAAMTRLFDRLASPAR